jgi:hypothetical protein
MFSSCPKVGAAVRVFILFYSNHLDFQKRCVCGRADRDNPFEYFSQEGQEDDPETAPEYRKGKGGFSEEAGGMAVGRSIELTRAPSTRQSAT